MRHCLQRDRLRHCKGLNKNTISIILISFIVFLFTAHISPTFASTSVITTSPDFDLGLYSNTESSSSDGNLKIESAGTWTGAASQIAPHPLTHTDGSTIGTDGTYMYILTGRNTDFRRYLPDENRWDQLADSPFGAGIYRGDMTYLDGYLYTVFSGYQKKFARYRVATDTWETLSDLPDYVHYGVTVETDGTYMYVLRGTNTTDFWRYDIAAGTWSSMTSPAATIYYGADLVYKDGYMYTPRGNNTTTYYRYDISGNSWSTMTSAPGTLRDNQNSSLVGDDIYVPRGYNTTDFYKYDISGNSWSTIATTPAATRYVGLVYVAGDDQIYVFRGNGQRDVWRYDYSGDSFDDASEMPASISTGSDVVYYNGYVYVPRGTGSNFYRYNVSSNAWETLTSSPATMQWDRRGTSAGSTLYWARGSGATFYSYSTSGNSWTTLSDAPASLGNGNDVAYPGSGDYLYVSRGQNTGSMYRYSISGNSWDDSAMDDLPSGIRMYIGSRMSTDNTYIYALTGGTGPAKLYRYDISGNSWSELDDLPFVPYYGTGVEYYNGKLYALQGHYDRTFWEYDISGNTWRKLEDFGGFYVPELGPYAGAGLDSDGSGTFYGTWGSIQNRLQVYSASADDYNATGTWTSQPIDLTNVSSFSTLSATEVTPSDSSVAYQTRTATDSANWSSWQSLSGSTIQSTAQRYIQVKATLTASTGNADTPTVSDITINYTGDEVVPTNPTAFTGLSQSVGGTSLTSGETYAYAHPVFSWTGASDADSTVAGYYVYFGTNATADPESAGTFQTGSTYVVTESLANATYYLRLKTKDSAGNVSAVTDGFTYVYQGVTTQSIVASDSADFAPTSVTNVATTSGEIKLSNQSAGFWVEERIGISPANMHGGAGWAYVSSSEKLYTFRGANTTTFYEYDIATKTWSTLSSAPATVRYGGTVVEGPDGYLYGLRGNNSNSFWRYNIGTDTWSDVDAVDTPSTVYMGGSAVYDGSQYIYVFRGNNDDAFWRYDTVGDAWDTMANSDFEVLSTVYYGGDLAYNGTDTIYAIQGNYRTGFSAYDISSDTWSYLPTLPNMAYTGATIEYDSTQQAVYFATGNSLDQFYKYDIATETWSKMPSIPYSVSYGGDIVNVDGTLYMIVGNNRREIYSFDTVTAGWKTPTLNIFGTDYNGSNYLPFAYGADIEKGDGNYFYFTRGNYDGRFARYDSSTGEVKQLASVPAAMYTGGDIVYDSTNDRIYVITSSGNSSFYYYDISTGAWIEETADSLPITPSTGASMTYDGSRYIYYARAGNTGTFYRYDTQASSGTRWSSALASPPATFNYGAELVYKGGYIYSLRGANIADNPFYRYDPGGDSWTTLSPLSTDVYNDGFLVDLGGDYMLACAGENGADCYRYSITGDSWEAIDNAPADIYQGGSAASNQSNIMYMIAGTGGSDSFSNGLYSYVPESSTSGFETTGSYYSQTHDMGSIYRFANLGLTYTAGTNTTLTVYTRTSADGDTWDSWTQVATERASGTAYTYEIKSAVQRYIQVRFDFTSGDGRASGVIDEYSVNYYQDTDVPTNPTAITAYSTATQSATLTTGNWYGHSAPNFDWAEPEAATGASDTLTGSGIAGYYVYFGTNASADPSTDGTLITATEYTASSLTTDLTYYFRMETIDDAGNVSSSVYSPFTYKYDSGLPTNPTTVNADPPGYSATNSFDFSWSGATDSASLIADYCYKTGEVGATETCTSDTSVTGIASYQAGTNSFKVRARDNAGNFASDYATVSYYYSSSAPSPPQNLSASPTSNTVNEFSFSWNAPSSFFGSQSNLRYYYSVNAIPTALNVNQVGLATTSLGSGSYATVPGENIFYVVAKDEAGNIDYSLYAQVSFTANTSAPGIPLDTEIADVSVKSTESWKLAISWDEPSSTGSGVANYKVYRSTTEGASCTTDLSDFTHIATTSEASYVNSSLTQQTYYYCASACDNTSNCSAPGDTVSFLPDGRWTSAPDLTASPSASVKTRTATITWATSRTSNSFVKYGKSSGDYGDEVGSSTQVTSHEVELDTLDPGTTYYFKALFTDEDGNTGESDEITFTTNPAPFVSNVVASDVSINTAFISATINNATSAVLQYGTSTSYGGSVPIATSKAGGTYTVKLEDLDEDSEYHYRIVADDDELNSYNGEDHTFQTLPIPRILNLKVQQVAGLPTATLRLAWTSNTEISSVVTYYPTANPERAQDNIKLVRTLSHDVLLTNLQDQVEYTIIVKGQDIVGNQSIPETRSLKTAADLRNPAITDMTVESTIVGVGQGAKAQIIVCWDTDEPSTTQVEYGIGTTGNFGATTQEDTNLAQNHCATITGAEASTIYQVRAVSKDKAGNKGTSFDTVTVTPRATKDALNLVIEKLSKTFGFIRNINIQ